MKYIDFKRYKFSTILKNIHLRRYNFLKINRYLNYKRYNFRSFYNSLKFHTYLNYKRYNFRSLYKYFDIRQYKLPKIYRYINYKKIKIIPLYIFGFAIISAFIYLCIPIFFTYDKSFVSKTLCSDLRIKCEIKGKINYSFIPYPKLKAQDLLIYDLVEKNKILAKFEIAEIRLPLNYLLDKKKLDFNKIKLQKAQINLNYKKLSEYIKHFTKDVGSKDITLKKGNIDDFGKLLHSSWILKKKLSKSITNNKIDELYDFVIKNGAYGGKILGAGAGGFLLF